MGKLYLSLASIKAAIFDMDGTMIDNMAYHKMAWQEFLKQHNITLSEEEFRLRISGKKNNEIFTHVLGKTLTTKEEEELTEEKEALYRDIYAPYITEVSGLTTLITELHERGIKTAIATTAPVKNRKFALRALGLESKFDVVLGDEHVKYGKPDPEIYLAAVKQLRVKPHECLVFEDSPPGVAAGRCAGMVVVGITTSHSAAELHEANHIVNDFHQLVLT